MICPYCSAKAEWCENSKIYGRNFGSSYMCYWCKNCGASVGCHRNSRTPLGTMANQELKRLRMRCHAFIDASWKDANYARRSVYLCLEKIFGFPVHISESNEEICRLITSLPFQKKFIDMIKSFKKR